jgi:hypothetical protein
MTQASGARVIEDFRGDFDALAAMMEASWAASETAPLLYTPDFVRSCFDYPGASFALAPTIYHGDDPAAFVAGFPRRISHAGRELDVLLVTFLTAAVEHHDSGYGIVIWSELVRRAQAAGFDGVVNYCVEGEAMNRMIVPACRRLRVPVSRVFSAHYLTKMLFRANSSVEAVLPAGAAAVLVDAAAPVTEQIELARVWSLPEADWQCSREGAVVTVADSGDAIVTGYVMEIANARRTRCLLVEDLLWGPLDTEARLELANRFLAQASAAGAQLAVAPQLGYADVGPLTATGFKPSGRTVHMYLTVFGDEAAPPVSSCYLDVV